MLKPTLSGNVTGMLLLWLELKLAVEVSTWSLCARSAAQEDNIVRASYEASEVLLRAGFNGKSDDENLNPKTSEIGTGTASERYRGCGNFRVEVRVKVARIWSERSFPSTSRARRGSSLS